MTTVNMAIPLILICFLVKNTIKKIPWGYNPIRIIPKGIIYKLFLLYAAFIYAAVFFCQSRISAERNAFLTAAAIK